MALIRVDSGLYQGYWTEITQEKRKGKFLFFFPTEWWQTVNKETVGSEIHCRVDDREKVDAVYVNSEKYIKEK